MRILLIFGVLAILTVAISFIGRWAGQTLSMGGHTNSTDIQDVFIDRDHLRIPANLIRFPAQRRTGTTDRINLHFTWPEMQGFTTSNSVRFNDQSQSETLLYIELSRRVMTYDMTDRFQPIYQTLLDGTTREGPAGLTIHPFKPDGPYKGEAILTKDRDGARSFVIRCILPAQGEPTSAADCQRDVYLGQDLSVMVRYSSKLLPQWNEIDQAVDKAILSLISD
ncbi:MAG: hypothetical protein RIR97_1729 [Pseudomonadota bacterium]